MYIYKTTNKINGKIYIGKSQKSVDESSDYLGSGLKLLKAIQKYGRDSFTKEILHICKNIEELNVKEIFFISLLNSTDRHIGYNIANGGSGGDLISTHPDRQKIIENCSGSGNPFFGRTHSQETRNKISKKRKGIKNKPETNEKIKLTLLRKYANNEITKCITDETKRKISEANTGRKHTKEELEKMSISSKGSNNPSAITWIFENENCVVIEVVGNFQNFCIENNLSIKAMRNIADGKRRNKYYNGWTVRRKQ